MYVVEIVVIVRKSNVMERTNNNYYRFRSKNLFFFSPQNFGRCKTVRIAYGIWIDSPKIILRI